MKKTIQMEELVCPMCAQKIETALQKVPGTPETLSRKLRELEREQIIKRERRMITLLQKQKLERYIIL